MSCIVNESLKRNNNIITVWFNKLNEEVGIHVIIRVCVNE